MHRTLQHARILVAAAAAAGCASTPSSPRPDRVTWLMTAPQTLERQFHLPAGSVRFDTLSQALDTTPGHRPSLWVIFSVPATERLGYNNGTIHFERLLKATWRTVPSGVSLDEIQMRFCQGDECGGPAFPMDSLTHLWRRSNP